MLRFVAFASAAALAAASSATVYITAPTAYTTPNEVFNISIRFSTGVTGFYPSMVTASNACPVNSRSWARVSTSGRTYIGAWRVGSACPRSAEDEATPGPAPPAGRRELQAGNPSVTLRVLSDVIPAGNEFSNFVVVPYLGPGSTINSTIIAPTFYSPSDTTLSVRLEFASTISPIQVSQLKVVGATPATTWSYSNCFFTASNVGSQQVPAIGESRPSEVEDAAVAKPRRAQIIPGGSCTVFVISLTPSGAEAPITVSIPANVASSYPTQAASVSIPFDNVSPRSKYNVTISTRNGRNTFGDNDRAVYVLFTFSGDQGTVVSGFVPEDIAIIPTGSAVPGSTWTIAPQPLLGTAAPGRSLQINPGQNPNTYELAFYPTANSAFAVLVGENVVAPPGNNRAFQNFTYSGSNGGDDRPPNVMISGDTAYNSTTSQVMVTFSWIGTASDVATFTQAAIRVASCSIVPGSFAALDSLNFQVRVIPEASAALAGARINVWVPALTVTDNTASSNFTSYFRSSLTPVRTTIEGPSFVTRPYCTNFYISTDQPVDVSTFFPSDLRVSGGALCGSSWIGSTPSRPPVGQLQDFVIAMRPNNDGNGGFTTMSISVPYNVFRLPQGNYGSNTRSTSYAASTGVRAPSCSLTSAAPTHSGANDEFLVEVTCADPVGGRTIQSSYSAFAVVGGSTYNYLQGTTFPASNFFVRVRPYGNSDVTVILPQNVASSPGNSRASITIPYDPSSPGSPVLTEILSADETHEGDTKPQLLVTVSFAKPSLLLVGQPVSAIVQVSGGSILNNAWDTAPSNFSGYSTFYVNSTVGVNITVSVAANVVPGFRNLAAALTIPYKAPGVLATISTTATGHDGRCPIPYSVTFGEPVTGFAATGVQIAGGPTSSVGASIAGSGAGPYTGMVYPNSYLSSMRIQVNQDVIASPSQGNFESRSMSVTYSVPSWRSALTPTIRGPASHDGYSNFKVNVTWPQSVTGFTTSGLFVTGGAANTDWDPLDASQCLTYTVEVQPSLQAAIEFTVPSTALPRPGNTPATITIPFQAQPTPSPGPTPSALPTPTPLPRNRCDTFGGLSCNYGECVADDGGYCRCNPGYAGYNCLIAVPNSTRLCFNNVQDTGESDVDCGGPCTPCASGRNCKALADCTGAEALCTKVGVCTPRLVNAAQRTGGKVVQAVISLMGVPVGQFTTDVAEQLRESLVSYIPSGSSSNHPYNAIDVLVTRVTSAATAVRDGEIDSAAYGRITMAAARDMAARDSVPVAERLWHARELASATNGTSIVSLQVNLAAAGDATDVIYWSNYAIAGNRLLLSLTRNLPGLHVASIQFVQTADVASAPNADLEPITGGTVPPPPGLSTGAIAGIGIGALFLGGILGAGILFSCGYASRRPAATKGALKPADGAGEAGMDTSEVVPRTGPTSRATVNPLEGMTLN